MDCSICISKESFKAISCGFQSVEIIKSNEITNNLKQGNIVCLWTNESPDFVIKKRISNVKVFGDIRIAFNGLNLLKSGYTPFTLKNASPYDIMKRYGLDNSTENDIVVVEFEEEPLQRFVAGQSGEMPDCSSYDIALKEIQNGRKETHWIWYVLPQIKGLTNDPVTAYFASTNCTEAQRYIQDNTLGLRLKEITEALLSLETNDPVSIFGMGDSFKLRACMTLFSAVSPKIDLFQRVIDKYCLGVIDIKTNIIIERKM